MRIPIYRAPGDETPTAWWEWPFFPLTCVVLVVYAIAIVLLLGILTVLTLLASPYFLLYPDHLTREYDFGTGRQQEVMRRYRRFTACVVLPSVPVRVLTFYCRTKRHQLPRRAIRALSGRAAVSWASLPLPWLGASNRSAQLPQIGEADTERAGCSVFRVLLGCAMHRSARCLPIFFTIVSLAAICRRTGMHTT